MHIYKLSWASVGADYAVSKNNLDFRKGHSRVMLSRSEASRRLTRQTPRGCPVHNRLLKLDELVGADLSGTPPIYRPYVAFHNVLLYLLTCIYSNSNRLMSIRSILLNASTKKEQIWTPIANTRPPIANFRNSIKPFLDSTVRKSK